MLTVNPKKRISAQKALESHWIQVGDPELEKRQLEQKKQKHLVEAKQKLKAGLATVRNTFTVVLYSASICI